jgi:hypothetical protein
MFRNARTSSDDPIEPEGYLGGAKVIGYAPGGKRYLGAPLASLP